MANDPDENDFWKEFGLETPVFETDLTNMPPVDKLRLAKLAANQLPESEARATYDLIHRFEPWRDAHTDMIVAQHHARKKK